MAETKWQPIESAPKDGRVVLVTGCNGFDRVLPAWWVDESEVIKSFAGWRGVVNRCGPNLIADPTHWMPLPDPPTGGE